MTDHPSNPDLLMARMLGVCWHSPTSDRWPCQEASPAECPDCGGSGRVRMANNRPYLSWAYQEREEPCPTCAGGSS